MNYKDKEAYSELGKSLSQKHLELLSTQLDVLKSALMNFAKDHWKDIEANAEFRQKFTQVCLSVGIKPLEMHLYAASKNAGSGKEQYYIGLAIAVVDICQETRDVNGGLISFKELLSRINDKKGLISNITSADVDESLKMLHLLGKGYERFEINKKKWLKFSSATNNNDKISDDQLKIFDTCEVMGGYVTYSLLEDNYGWDSVRCKTILDEMISEGLLWVDFQGEDGVQYWEPSWISR